MAVSQILIGEMVDCSNSKCDPSTMEFYVWLVSIPGPPLMMSKLKVKVEEEGESDNLRSVSMECLCASYLFLPCCALRSSFSVDRPS